MKEINLMATHSRDQRPIDEGDSKPMTEVLLRLEEGRDLLTGQPVVLSLLRPCRIVIDAYDRLPAVHVVVPAFEAILEQAKAYSGITLHTLSNQSFHVLRLALIIGNQPGQSSIWDMSVGPIDPDLGSALAVLSRADRFRLTLHNSTPDDDTIPVFTRLVPWTEMNRRAVEAILVQTAYDQRLWL
jgi:hypothetical protein